jgi:hypothetical protein
MARTIKQVNFDIGIHLHGIVVQSIGVGPSAGDQNRSLSGVRLVEKIEFHEKNVGVKITMATGANTSRIFTIPWSHVTSIEEVEEEVPVQAVAGKR